MGGGQSAVPGKRQRTPAKAKVDLPWIKQKPPSISGSTSGESGRQVAPESSSSAADMADNTDEVFENASYVFVVMGASVSVHAYGSLSEK